MKFGYVESWKPTRDEHIGVIDMVEAGLNINDVARKLHIHKTTAYRTVNRFWQTGLAERPPKSISTNGTESTGGTFHSYHIKAEEISFSKPALWKV